MENRGTEHFLWSGGKSGGLAHGFEGVKVGEGDDGADGGGFVGTRGEPVGEVAADGAADGVLEAHGVVGAPAVLDPDEAGEDGDAEDHEEGFLRGLGGVDDEGEEQADADDGLEEERGDGVFLLDEGIAAAKFLDEEGEGHDDGQGVNGQPGEPEGGKEKGGDANGGPDEAAGDGHGGGAGGQEACAEVLKSGHRKRIAGRVGADAEEGVAVSVGGGGAIAQKRRYSER